MAKPTGGLIAFDARGQLGKTIVYSSWRGRDYVRRYVIPANPRTAAQITNRNLFHNLQEIWKVLPSAVQEVWFAAAKGKPLTDRNFFTKWNLPDLTGSSDLSPIGLSPGAGGGIFPAASSIVGGVGTVTVGLTAPSLPTDWTIDQMTAYAVKDHDPTGTNFTWFAVGAVDTTSPYSSVLTVPSTGSWLGGAFFRYTKPDGSKAYSLDPNSLVTVT